MMKCFLFTFAYCCVLILKGQNLIPYQFTEYGGKYGYIDKTTNEAKIFWHFDKAYPFYMGIALVEYNNKLGGIDSLGNIVIPINFNYIKIISPHKALISDSKNNIPYTSDILKEGRVKLFDSSWANNTTRLYTKEDSKLKNIFFIDTDIDKKVIENLQKEYILNSLSDNVKVENKKKIWNNFQIGVIDNAKRQGFYELKGATYLQNKNFLTGISYGFQRTKLFSNNGTYFNYQIPVYLSQILFFKQPQKGSSAFIKMDVGYVLSEYSFIVNNGTKLKYNGNVFQTNLLLNCGFGIKLSPPNKPTGALLELGYKFLPQRMHLVENTNYINLLLGMIF